MRERVEGMMGESISGQGCKRKEGQGERKDNDMKGIVGQTIEEVPYTHGSKNMCTRIVPGDIFQKPAHNTLI